MTRVLVADDHLLFRQGLKRLFEESPNLRITGEAEDGEQALALACSDKSSWDLMLLDISLPVMNGLEVLRRMRARGIALPVLVLSMHPADDYASQAVRLGASGYLDKNCSADELIRAMDKVSQGGSYLNARSAHDLFFRIARGRDQLLHLKLSPRELEVFSKLARGRSITKISSNMGVSAKTISTYRARILQKLDMTNNADIVRYSLTHNMI